MGLNQQYQHVSVNISAQDVEECCSGQFLQKIWARRKVGQELIQSVYPPHAPITTTAASLVQACEDKPVDIVHLLFWRLDHLQQEMAITVVCLGRGGTKVKVSALGPRRRDDTDGKPGLGYGKQTQLKV